MEGRDYFKIGLAYSVSIIIFELFLFSSFWLARTFFLYDLYVLAIFRSHLLLLLVPVLLFGVYFLYRSKRKIILRFTVGLISILIHLPILYVLRSAQTDIDSRAYVKIYNNSGVKLSTILIKEPDRVTTLKELDKESSQISYYYPDYNSYENSRGKYKGISGNILEIRTSNETYDLIIPNIHPGELVKLNLDKNFNLTRM